MLEVKHREGLKEAVQNTNKNQNKRNQSFYHFVCDGEAALVSICFMEPLQLIRTGDE